MKALVVGATGRTGRRIVEELVQRQIPVVAAVRDRQKAEGLFPAGVEIKLANVNQPESLAAAIADCTVVLCATGATPSLNPLEPYWVDYEGTKNLVDAAKSAAIEQFVLVSSLCVSQFFHPLNIFWLILYWKQQAERYLQESGLTYTIVRPGGLKESSEEEVFPVISGPDTLFDGSIPRSQVAQICVEALQQPKARNKILEVVARPMMHSASLAELFNAVG